MALQSQRQQLALLYAVIFLYALCFMAQAPLLPYQVKQLGVDVGYYGTLQSTFSALQLLGGLLSGPLVDRYGGRVLLLLSFGASALCYVLTATATSIHMLLVSRLATLMQHAMLAARTIAAHSFGEEQRAALLGRLGAAYGMGFALGPAAGGLLSSISLPATAWAAAAGSLLAAGIVLLGLPPDGPGGADAKHPAAAAATGGSGSSSSSSSSGPNKQASLASLAAVTRYRGVPALLVMQGGANLAGALMQSTFALMLQQRYQLSSRDNGLVLSWVGVCVATGQVFVIKPVSAYLGEAAAVKASCGVLTLTLLAIGAAGRLWQLLLALVPMACSTVMISTLNTARLSKSVPPGLAGTVMALDMSLASGLRTVAPLAGTALVQRHGFAAVCLAASSVLLASFTAAGYLPAPVATGAAAAATGDAGKAAGADGGAAARQKQQ